MPKMMMLLLLVLMSLSLGAQIQFDIQTFSDSTKYGWQDWRDRSAYREELYDRQQLLQMYEIESSPIGSAILKSALIPGFGQITSNAGTKGTVILGSELLALSASLYFYDRSRFYYDKYLNATQVDEIQEYYSAAQNPSQYSMAFIGLAAVIWAYNIFDVILTTDEYNAQVWQEIVEQYGKKTVSMGPEGLRLKF